MRRPIKAHLVNRSNRPVNRSKRPVYRSKPVTHAILNLDLNSNRSNRPVNRSNRPVYRYEPVELSFLNSNFNSTGFRPNRTGIPVPDPGGLAGPVGKLNSAGLCMCSTLVLQLVYDRDRSLITCSLKEERRKGSLIHCLHSRVSPPRPCTYGTCVSLKVASRYVRQTVARSWAQAMAEG